MLMILWWTRIFNENVDLIFTAMNAHEILDYDGLKFQRECGLDLYSNECLWNSRLWWTKISTRMWIGSIQQWMLMKFSTMMDQNFLTSIRVWPLQQWMLMKLSDTLFHYDMLWFSKRRPTRCRHDDLNFSNLQCPERLFVNL